MTDRDALALSRIHSMTDRDALTLAVVALEEYADNWHEPGSAAYRRVIKAADALFAMIERTHETIT